MLAGLLLEQHNVLVLDEPGNHLDVETDRSPRRRPQTQYEGTVDLHEPRPATSCARSPPTVDRSGRGTRHQLPGELRRLRLPCPARRSTPASAPRRAPPSRRTTPPPAASPGGRADRDAQKRLKSVERKIAKLDDEKKTLNSKLLAVTEADEATKTQQRLAEITDELEGLEAEWLELSEEVGAW